jgi:RNA polymerase sigma-70 factor (ECF subfamily)
MINQSLPTSSLQAFQMNENKFQITDEDLILRFQSGDENAYSEIVSRYRDRLVNFIFRFMNDFDQAEDLAQDTLLKVYTHKHYYKNIAKFSTWIYTIASNLAKTELRKKKNRKTSSLSNMGLDDKEYDLPAADKKTDSETDNEFLGKKIQYAIDKLPENFKTVAILRDVQELSYDDISNILNVPLGTVKSRINRARIQLQEELKNFL